MHKTKMFTIFSAFMFVLSLGACSEEQFEEANEESISNSNSDDSFSNQEVYSINTPAEFIDKACETGNYSVQIVIDEYESESITIDDYNNKNYDQETLLENLTWTEYVIEAYYTEDALLIDYYLYYSGYLVLLEEDLYVNTTYYGIVSSVEAYFTSDGSTWYYYTSYSGYTWQDIFYSLFDNSLLGLGEKDFTFVESYDGLDVYDFATYSAMFYFGYLVGADLWNYSWLSHLYYFDYVYFSLELQMMLTSYYGSGWFYTDDSYSYVHILEDDFYTTFYDVGETDISEVVSYVETNATDY